MNNLLADMNSLTADLVIERMKAEEHRTRVSAQFEHSLRMRAKAADMKSECVKTRELCTAGAPAASLRLTQNLPILPPPAIFPRIPVASQLVERA